MAEPLPHDIMGYDRAITVFSPDGRLLQVEYAKKTVAQGATAIGIMCKDGIVLMADKRIAEKLIVPESVEKIYKIDAHLGAAVTGITSDGRVLMQKAQAKAQSHKITYDEQIDVLSLVKEVCDQQHLFTQYGGARPYGVALILGGMDVSGPRLFMTEPSGIYFEYKATSVGEGAPVVNKIFEAEYKENMNIEQGIKLGISALKKALGDRFNKERTDIAVISEKFGGFKKLDKQEIEKYLKK